MSEWSDLGDDELVARLVQRGLPKADALSWADYREVPSARAQIDEFFREDVADE